MQQSAGGELNEQILPCLLAQAGSDRCSAHDAHDTADNRFSEPMSTGRKAEQHADTCASWLGAERFRDRGCSGLYDCAANHLVGRLGPALAVAVAVSGVPNTPAAEGTENASSNGSISSYTGAANLIGI